MKQKYFLIIICIFAIFTLHKQESERHNNNANMQIILNDILIDEISLYENVEYTIDSDANFIYVYKNKNLFNTIENKKNKIVYNKILVQNGVVKVTESNCKGKDCMLMKIDKNTILPIICTNGLVIKLVDNKQYGDIIV